MSGPIYRPRRRPGHRLLGRLAGTVAVLATLVAAALPMVPAAADDEPVPWPDTAACATGEFTGHTVHPPDFQGLYLELTGWAQQCGDEKEGAPPPPAARFGFAYFAPPEKESAAGLLFEGRLRSYGPGLERTPFAGRFDLSATGPYPTDSPICLMRDRTTRVACVQVRMVFFGQAPSLVVTPLAPGDAVVTGPVTVHPDGSETTPNCGHCL
jgi:hypothetical protein